MAAQPLPYALEVSPESALKFIITRDAPTNEGGDGVSRCVMTLTHTGLANHHLAFKVKTTQPRRYLVRPNQGIVAPGTSETVSILLVDKDRQVLWDTYNRLGQSALDHSKDKFLVQSCEVSNDFSSQFQNEPRVEGGQYKKELVEALTGMWNMATSVNKDTIFNKKLHVRHVVGTAVIAGALVGGPSSAGAAVSLPPSFQEDVDAADINEKMSPEQIFEEVASLRRKYDELVAFSVNLTAERDILNNTLEQTKRDLNREMASRSVLEKQGLKISCSPDKKSSKSAEGISFRCVLVAVIVSFVLAVKATNSGSMGMLGKVPIVGGVLGFENNSMLKNAVSGVENARVDL